MQLYFFASVNITFSEVQDRVMVCTTTNCLLLLYARGMAPPSLYFVSIEPEVCLFCS